MRLDDRFDSQQIVPKALVTTSALAGRNAHCAKANCALLPGWGCRNKGWVPHNEHGAIARAE